MRSTPRSTQLLPRVLLTAIALMTALIIAAPQFSSAAPGFAWASIDMQVRQLAPEHNLLVAEFAGNSCKPIHNIDADNQLAIASTFKIYVLGELARQVQAGTIDWDDRITLSDHLRSMPSGDYAWAPVGSQVSVRDLAEAMMWHSDNTATDHLIDRLGRENVEEAFLAYGHANPEVNQPLLYTRELFAIKMWQPADWMGKFASATQEERLALLTTDVGALSVNPGGGWGKWNGPTEIDDIEWFASAEDLCKAMVSLWTLGAQPGLEPVRDILSGNRGGVMDSGIWPAVAHKNGYEAGVVNATYVLEREDGRVFFASVGFNHPQWVVDQSAPLAVLGPVFSCLASYDDVGDCDT